jgi:8-oxo-dGTP diphosphatase
MSVGKFLGGVAALIWDEQAKKYLFLRRAPKRDFKAGAWECVTGRVDQGESFEDALHREVFEEIQSRVWIDYVIATSHFYRGAKTPENELLSIIYGCTIQDAAQVIISDEHSEMRWATVEEALGFLPEGDWLREVILRAEALRENLPEVLRLKFRQQGFDI